MANCKDCIHYEPCFEYGNILDPIHGGVKCDSFKSTADVVPKSEVERLNKKIDVLKRDRYQVFPDGRLELLPRTDLDKIKAEVAREIFEEMQSCLMIRHWHGNDILTFEFDAVKYAELKKKYTEDKK